MLPARAVHTSMAIVMMADTPILTLLERKSPKGMYKREPIASPTRNMDTNFNEKESYSRSSSNVKDDANVSLYVRRAEVDKRYPCTRKANDTVNITDSRDFLTTVRFNLFFVDNARGIFLVKNQECSWRIYHFLQY